MSSPKYDGPPEPDDQDLIARTHLGSPGGGGEAIRASAYRDPAAADTYTYASVEAFYAARPERRASLESDYGVHWRSPATRPWPQWRVSYVRATGEVYAVRLHGRPPGPVWVLGTVPADPVADPARESWTVTLDRVLDGWADPAVTGLDLAWAARRLASHARR